MVESYNAHADLPQYDWMIFNSHKDYKGYVLSYYTDAELTHCKGTINVTRDAVEVATSSPLVKSDFWPMESKLVRCTTMGTGEN